MKNKWLLFIFLVALVMVSGCADEQADDTTSGQVQEPAAEAEQTADEVPASAVEPVEYGVRMDYTYFSPAVLDMNRGDTVVWRNSNKQKVYTLVSSDGLFGDQVMKYGNTYSYTFENSGSYNFSEADTPEMTMTVNVR